MIQDNQKVGWQLVYFFVRENTYSNNLASYNLVTVFVPE